MDEDIIMQSKVGDDFLKDGAQNFFDKINMSVELAKTPSSPRHNDADNYHVTQSYSASFPDAMVHGWEGIAPGVTSDSPNSMILHLQQTIEYLIENDVNRDDFEKVNAYLKKRQKDFEGRSLSYEIDLDWDKEVKDRQKKKIS